MSKSASAPLGLYSSIVHCARYYCCPFNSRDDIDKADGHLSDVQSTPLWMIVDPFHLHVSKSANSRNIEIYSNTFRPLAYPWGLWQVPTTPMLKLIIVYITPADDGHLGYTKMAIASQPVCRSTWCLVIYGAVFGWAWISSPVAFIHLCVS